MEVEPYQQDMELIHVYISPIISLGSVMTKPTFTHVKIILFNSLITPTIRLLCCHMSHLYVPLEFAEQNK